MLIRHRGTSKGIQVKPAQIPVTIQWGTNNHTTKAQDILLITRACKILANILVVIKTIPRDRKRNHNSMGQRIRIREELEDRFSKHTICTKFLNRLWSLILKYAGNARNQVLLSSVYHSVRNSIIRNVPIIWVVRPYIKVSLTAHILFNVRIVFLRSKDVSIARLWDKLEQQWSSAQCPYVLTSSTRSAWTRRDRTYQILLPHRLVVPHSSVVLTTVMSVHSPSELMNWY
jgi:hypothetical protein